MPRKRQPRQRRVVPDLAERHTLRLSGQGAGMLLGDLEHALMEAAWRAGAPAPAKALHARIERARDIELITAVTVLNRLVKRKRLLRREKINGVFHYSPVLHREEFFARASRHVAERVLALGAEAITASIVDVLAARDLRQLEELGRLVRRKLRERQGND